MAPFPNEVDSTFQVLVSDKGHSRKVEPLLRKGLEGIKKLRSKDTKL